MKDLINTILFGDCLELMNDINDKSIDLIVCDLPYGTTMNKWDVIIPFDKLWEHYERIIKDNGAILLTAAQPFTTELINSKKELFRYDLIWYKPLASGFLNANRMPMRNHEHILVFYKSLPTYNPIMQVGRMRDKGRKSEWTSENYGSYKPQISRNDKYHPESVISISNGDRTKESDHPTQKPVKLFQYLIETYSNENDLVLDNCIGSGTTAIACIESKRNFIGIESNSKYFNSACKRIEKHLLAPKLF